MKELHDATRHLVERYRQLARLLTGDDVQRALDAVDLAVIAVEEAETTPSGSKLGRARDAVDEAEATLRALSAALADRRRRQ